MSVTCKVITGEEARNTVNGVGLDSVNWDGSLLSLKLLDGTAIEINAVNETGEGEVEKPLPSFVFSHRKIPRAKNFYQSKY